MKATVKLFISLSLLVVPCFAFADIDASVSLTPSTPLPNTAEVLTLTSYSFDVNTAMITWKSGGKTLLSGFGAKTLSVSMGDVGQIIPISYRAETADGSYVEGTIALSAQSVDLVYEPIESYAPTFYEGLTLPGEGSAVRITAVPTIGEAGKRLAPSNLSYSWYVNGEYMDGASGAGRSTMTILLDYLTNSTEVRVLVRSPSGSVAEKTISIAPHDVIPALYAYDDILGVDLSRMFVRRLELDRDITLSLQPYFLSNRLSLSKTATYEWYMDGLPVTPLQPTQLALKPKENSYGTRLLSVVVGNSKRELQETKSELEIVFDTRK
jgi:hypothetical protein